MTFPVYEPVLILYFGATAPVSVLPEVAAMAITSGLAVEYKPPTENGNA
jgi:hypothetical protein